MSDYAEWSNPRVYEKARELAARLGVTIPHQIPINMWMLPLLEVLVDRLEKLEGKDGKVQG